ncbi:hypothetical protein FSPOR_4127 [Fusarium sporotrichioides]|uniref:Uncharacterized protein n=1 Tax=Fusarium sporotrichioides TaxID=5514 RepID=A0A395SDI1_FUSSP|nr:hypothetical protein FSPOR_4127 [Fusarium sporotrichioides]
MQFSLATVITVLSATASGWSLTAYSGMGCRINVNAADELYRKLDAPFRGCFTFGQDMPGVSCSEVRPGGGGPQGCAGELFPKSIFVNGDCNFYSGPNCQGADGGQEMAFSTLGRETCIQIDPTAATMIGSYFCYSDDSHVDST